MLTFIEGEAEVEVVVVVGEVTEEEEGGEEEGRDNRAQATAWFAPFPPNPVSKDVTRRVSPAEGTRGVRVMKSMFREPITAIVRVCAAMVWLSPSGLGGVRCGLEVGMMLRYGEPSSCLKGFGLSSTRFSVFVSEKSKPHFMTDKIPKVLFWG